MVLRLERWLAVLGTAAIVLALSKVHAAWIADPEYDFTGSFRFGWALGYIVAVGLANYAVGLPEQPRTAMQALWAATVGSAIAASTVSLAQLIVGDALLPRFVVFASAGLAIPWNGLVNVLARRKRGGNSSDRVLLVATASETASLIEDMELDLEHAATIVARFTPDEVNATTPHTGTSLVDACTAAGANLVVLDRHALEHDHVVAEAARLHERGLRIRSLVDFYSDWLGKLPLSELERASLMFDIREVHHPTYTRVKRGVDVLAGIAGTALLVLVTPFVLIGNLAANRGPLLFRQERVGKGGRPFSIYKFRTMTPDGTGARNDHSSWTAPDDPRITRFGGVLRRSHLDELPQAINILRGDLSVVGPRPEQPRYVEELREKLPFYDLRHLVRPGLTGWAQVKYGYGADEHDALEKLQYEFHYLRNQSVTLDARICLRTLRSVVGGRGRGR